MPASLAQIIFQSSGATQVVRDGERIRENVTGIQSVAASLKSTLMGLAAAYVSLRGAQKLLELGKLGEDIADVENAFNRLSGSGTLGLQQLRAAVNDTIDDLQLMRYANAALQKGMSFEQVALAFEFAKIKAEETGGTFGGTGEIFNTVTTALSRLELGTGNAARSLVPLGIYGKSAAEVMAQLDKTVSAAANTMDERGDTFDKFNARMENIRQMFAKGFHQASNDFITSLDEIYAGMDKLAGIEPPLAAGIQGPMPATPPKPMDEETRKHLEALDALVKATSPIAEMQAKLGLLRLELQALTEGSEDYLNKQNEIKHLEWEMADAQTKADADSSSAAKQAISDDQARLKGIRDRVKANIAAGDATYADLANVIEEQKKLYTEDFDFQTGLIQDMASVKSNSASEEQKRQSAILNSARDSTDLLMRDESLSMANRLAQRLRFYQQIQAFETLDSEHRQAVQKEIWAAEDALTSHLEQQMQERVNNLMTVFGQPFLSALDKIFMGGKLRMEDFLRDLTRSIMHFLAQRALLKLFSMLAGGIPGLSFGGGGGAPGNLIPYTGGGMASSGRGGTLSDQAGSILSGLSIAINKISPPVYGGTKGGYPSITVLPAPVNIQTQILATPEGLAATVKTGQHHLRKTDLTR